MNMMKYDTHGRACEVLQDLGNGFSLVKRTKEIKNYGKVTYQDVEEQEANAFLFDSPLEKKPTLSQKPSFFEVVRGLDAPLCMPLFLMYKSYLEGKLNLSPEYQREFVWTEHQQQAYLQAILDEKVEPIAYLCLELEDGKDKEEVLDGKQRLTTLFHFLENKVSLPSGVYFRDLGLEDVQRFYYQNVKYFLLSISGYHRNLSNQEKLDIFLMINEKGTKLTEQELQRAKDVLTVK